MTGETHFIGSLFLGGMLALLTVGCLSPELLSERKEHLPAPDPQVELRLKSAAPPDVLVLYNEHDPASGKVTRRAFYLFGNEMRLTDGKRPVFVSPYESRNHTPIPICKERPADPKSIPGELYAVSSQPFAFELQSNGRTVAEFTLPQYGDWLTAKKFFLFPLAAAADAVGIGAAAGAAAAAEAVRSGNIPVR